MHFTAPFPVSTGRHLDFTGRHPVATGRHPVETQCLSVTLKKLRAAMTEIDAALYFRHIAICCYSMRFQYYVTE